jgi:hypothetical protein
MGPGYHRGESGLGRGGAVTRVAKQGLRPGAAYARAFSRSHRRDWQGGSTMANAREFARRPERERSASRQPNSKRFNAPEPNIM